MKESHTAFQQKNFFLKKGKLMPETLINSREFSGYGINNRGQYSLIINYYKN